MKKLLITLVFVGLAGILGVSLVDLRPERPPREPVVLHSARGEGALQAGAAISPINVGAGVPLAGYARWRWASTAVRDPVAARALVLSVPGCSVALVSAELLLIPAPLTAAVRQRVSDLKLDTVIVTATHTHAGPGGYWQHPLARTFATGRYDPAIFDRIASAVADAIRTAHANQAPAKMRIVSGSAADLARNRSGDVVEGRLLELTWTNNDGAEIGSLEVFAAHPTILGLQNRALSGDWPGALMRSRPGVALFMQGAVGDQSVAGQGANAPNEYAEALAKRLDLLRARGPEVGALALETTSVTVSLPQPDLGRTPKLGRLTDNAMSLWAPETTEISAVRFGALRLFFVPGEPVADVAAKWRGELGEDAEVIALANDYVGYVATPEQVLARTGESHRTYFGSELGERLGVGLAVAKDSAERR